MILNPDPVELRKMMFRQPGVQHTEFGSVSYSTQKKDENDLYITEDHNILFSELVKLQNAHLTWSDSIVIDGFMSGSPNKGVHVKFIVDKEFPHLAAMARTMLFNMGHTHIDPKVKADITIYCTPRLECPKLRRKNSKGFTRAKGNAITFIDREDSSARIIGSDRFEEVRRTMLNLWTEIIEERGDIGLFGSIRNEQIPGDECGLLMLGSDEERLLVSAFGGERNLICQPSVVGFDPNNGPYVADRGAFLSIHGRDSSQRRLFEAICSQTAVLQDAVVDPDTEVVDFENSVGGMATFYLPFEDAEFCEPKRYKQTSYIILLESDSDLTPAACRFTSEQLGARLFLNGKDFFLSQDNFTQKVDKIFEYVRAGNVQSYMLNNSSVAGGYSSMPVEQHQAAIRACVIGSVEWERSELLGFDVPAVDIVGVDSYLTNPALSYGDDNRHYEYLARASIFRSERERALRLYWGANSDIVHAFGAIETDLDRDDKHEEANEAGLKAFTSNGVSYLTENAMFSAGYCLCDGSVKYYYCPFHDEYGIHGVRK